MYDVRMTHVWCLDDPINPYTCMPSTFLWDIGKQFRPRSDAVCLQTDLLKFEKKKENTTQQPLKWKWTGPYDKSRTFHLA